MAVFSVDVVYTHCHALEPNKTHLLTVTAGNSRFIHPRNLMLPEGEAQKWHKKRDVRKSSVAHDDSQQVSCYKLSK